jgi:hypothetical protein
MKRERGNKLRLAMKKYTKNTKLYWPSRAKKEFDVLKEPIPPPKDETAIFFLGKSIFRLGPREKLKVEN